MNSRRLSVQLPLCVYSTQTTVTDCHDGDSCVPPSCSVTDHSSKKSQISHVSGTTAWSREPKSSGKLVGERLTSFQHKLRALLSQSQPSIQRVTKKPKTSGSVGFDNIPSLNAPQLSKNDASTSAAVTSDSSCVINSIQPGQSSIDCILERHPFEPSYNFTEQDDVADPNHIRDTCNKLFMRNQRSSWSSCHNPRNCYSNNIKSAYDYDKLVPKEVIGKSCQEKKPEITKSVQDICENGTDYSNFLPFAGNVQEQRNHALFINLNSDAKLYSAKKLHDKIHLCSNSSKNAESVNIESYSITKKKSSVPNDYSDFNDYKSSSESGHGTMQSSVHGSKVLISSHSSRLSAASNLDTSIDSDHSTTEGLWEGDESRYVHSVISKHRGMSLEKSDQGEAFNSVKSNTSELYAELNFALAENSVPADSLCSPTAHISPPPSSPVSSNSSPLLVPKSKHSLSIRTSMLSSQFLKPAEHQVNKDKLLQEAISLPVLTQESCREENDVEQLYSTTHTSCQHICKKGKCHCLKSSANAQLGFSHRYCEKKNCGSGEKQISKAIEAEDYLCCSEHAELELTSTTTGLDGESQLDNIDDFSSDLSLSTSTVKTADISMIKSQLEGLENMYSQILHVLGVKNNALKNSRYSACASELPKNTRQSTNTSFCSLTQRSLNKGAHSFTEKKRWLSEKRKSKSGRSGSSKRLQRLESHVVTLARSVAHLSSEMRTHHMLVQELESMHRDISWMQERLRLIQLTQSCNTASSNVTEIRHQQLSSNRNLNYFHKALLELLKPERAKKLTKFFGDEPPLIRQFLKHLGYEKYASIFESEKIGIMELPFLTEERLQRIGLPMGPRIRILQEAWACQQNQYKVYIV